MGWLFAGLISLIFGAACLAVLMQGVLTSAQSASAWVSRESWERIVTYLTGRATLLSGNTTVSVPFSTLFLPILTSVLSVWLVCGVVAGRRTQGPTAAFLAKFGLIGGALLMLPGLLELASIFLPVESRLWIRATSHLWLSACLAGFMATPVFLLCSGKQMSGASSGTAWMIVLLGVAASVVTFTWMNWSLYWNLLLPHGDSAMYEEHIWNLTHGKGFRSYLDQGLFLGEHIQVVHLLLTPLHVLWPSQLLLELCESLALGMSAIPVFLIARRHTAAPFPAALLAITWLLYFPMHYLDIAIDFKTFRPMCFGVPAILFGIDQWERKRFKSALLLFLLALSAKEDFALVLAPLTLYLGLEATEKSERRLGIVGAAAIVAYLVFVVLIVIPAFRSGEAVHYSRYFGELGSSPSEIVRTAVCDPTLVLSKLFSLRSGLYSLLLLLPCGFLPLFSPRRLLVAVPVLGMLYLLELSPEASGDGEAQQQMLVPFHHFHATVMPILWWAAATGLGRLRRPEGCQRLVTAAAFACFAALLTGLFYSMSPLGISFHDPGSREHWRKLYVQSQRALEVEKVLSAVPMTARVASTDFVHTRLTHRERSYDYSGYRTKVPADANYIVIDARHPWPGYSIVQRSEDVRELKTSPNEWEVMPVDTGGYFIVLRRRIAPAE